MLVTKVLVRHRLNFQIPVVKVQMFWVFLTAVKVC